MAGKTWMRKTKDREEWRRLSEGYVLQWTDNAYKEQVTSNTDKLDLTDSQSLKDIIM